MNTDPIPAEGRLNRDLRNARLDAHNAEVLERITRETSGDLPATDGPLLSLLGDERQLRGIPVVGARGVGGAIAGTRPGSNIR